MSKIFAEVPFHKISGFYYTQNIQLFWHEETEGTAPYQARRNEKNSGGGLRIMNVVGPMVGRRTTFFISNCLKRLGKLNICRR